MQGEPPEDATLFPRTVGEKLRDARVALGLDLADVAARTRIPQRHLAAIEQSQYSGLPSITYAMGFAKGYARAVELDEAQIARELRVELDMNYDRAPPTPVYEMEDPSRVPPRGLALAGVLVAVLVLIGVGLWYGTSWFREAAPETVAAAPAEVAPQPVVSPEPTPTPETGGQVTLVAAGEVWVRVYDAANETLLMKTMAPGERYDVPATANNPMVNVGRPDLLQVLVNGSQVPPLGTADRAIKDVPVSADALRARGTRAAPAAAPTPRASATPAREPLLPPAFDDSALGNAAP